MTIQYRAESICGTIFRCRGSVLPSVLLMGLWGAFCGMLALVLQLTKVPGFAPADPNIDLHTYIGLIIGLLLVFRTNISYQRYDTGVSALGAIQISARNLIQMSATSMDKDAHESVVRIGRLVVLFFAIVKKVLHGTEDLHNYVEAGVVTPAEERILMNVKARTRPGLVCMWLRKEFASAMRNGHAEPSMFVSFEQECGTLLAAYQRCLRLKTIPMPFPYAQLVKIIVLAFVSLAPFGFVADLEYATPVAAFCLALTMFGVDAIGVEIEDPFGKDANDLKIKPMVMALDYDVKQYLEQSGVTTRRYFRSLSMERSRSSAALDGGRGRDRDRDPEKVRTWNPQQGNPQQGNSQPPNYQGQTSSRSLSRDRRRTRSRD